MKIVLKKRIATSSPFSSFPDERDDPFHSSHLPFSSSISGPFDHMGMGHTGFGFSSAGPPSLGHRGFGSSRTSYSRFRDRPSRPRYMNNFEALKFARNLFSNINHYIHVTSVEASPFLFGNEQEITVHYETQLGSDDVDHVAEIRRAVMFSGDVTLVSVEAPPRKIQLSGIELLGFNEDGERVYEIKPFFVKFLQSNQTYVDKLISDPVLDLQLAFNEIPGTDAYRSAGEVTLSRRGELPKKELNPYYRFASILKQNPSDFGNYTSDMIKTIKFVICNDGGTHITLTYNKPEHISLPGIDNSIEGGEKSESNYSIHPALIELLSDKPKILERLNLKEITTISVLMYPSDEAGVYRHRGEYILATDKTATGFNPYYELARILSSNKSLLREITDASVYGVKLLVEKGMSPRVTFQRIDKEKSKVAKPLEKPKAKPVSQLAGHSLFEGKSNKDQGPKSSSPKKSERTADDIAEDLGMFSKAVGL